MAAPPGAPMGPIDLSLIPYTITPEAFETAKAFAGVAIALNILAFTVFSGRIWTRLFPVLRMGADDYVITVAYFLALADSILLLMTIPYIFGRDPTGFNMSDGQTSYHYAIAAQPIWAWAMAAIKCSIALMLLRLESSRNMRRFLYVMIGFQVALATYNMLSQLLQCFPLHKAWDLMGLVPGTCWTKKTISISSIAVGCVNVITDFMFALLPLSFLRNLQRPLRERIIIAILMGLGLFAGAASIVKIVKAERFGLTDDPNLESINIGMWSCIEIQVGFIAACFPCLRSPFQRALEYFGLVTAHGRTTYGRGYGEMYGESKKQTHRSKKSVTAVDSGRVSTASGVPIRMQSMRNTDSASEENILPEEGKNGEIWCTTEVHLDSRDAEKGRR